MNKYTITTLIITFITINLYGQQDEAAIENSNDTIHLPEITFTPASASAYIVDLLDRKQLWKPEIDSIKIPLTRLIYQYNEPYDSIGNILSEFQDQPVSFRKVDTASYDTLPLRWLNDSTFFIDTIQLGREPLYVQKTVFRKIIDSIGFTYNNIPRADSLTFSTYRIRDTITNANDVISKLIIDTALLKSKKMQLFQLRNQKVSPGVLPEESNKTYQFNNDSSAIVLTEFVPVIVANKKSPFNIISNEKIPDSLRVAIQSLSNYITQRDSVLIYFKTTEGQRIPFWLTVGEDELYRFWVKNQKNDSVTLWMGNPDKKNITLALEEDIGIERYKKETVDDMPLTRATPTINLAQVKPLKEIPVFWDYNFSNSFSLNQNYLSYWAKGGENSFSAILDIRGQAEYTNKIAKTEWINSGRLKYGNLYTEEHGFRKNTDLLEFNSKFNKLMKGKIDFSAIFYIKNQIARGYRYPNDSVIVSKFLNPGTFTIGVGAEYKPFKKTSVNFSLLSYKNTFALDTANIDQTIHGIDKNKRANQEMGGQLLVKNQITLFDDLTIKNSLRLFSNYMEKPQNFDVDWEIDLEKQISLFFTVLLNVHMIYDENILFSILDENKEPILLPSGKEKKAPRVQFKQYLGLTFLFKL